MGWVEKYKVVPQICTASRYMQTQKLGNFLVSEINLRVYAFNIQPIINYC